MKIFFVMLLLIIPNSHVFSQISVKEYTELNTEKENYAATFRSDCGKTEIWKTSSYEKGNPNSRKIVIGLLVNGNLQFKDMPFPINQKIDKGLEHLYLDGSPCFNSCNPNYGVFVSNRTHDGKYYDNDVYEMMNVNGQWTIRRIEEINSPYWDDTPSLSPDGRFLYFASTRNKPGLGISEIFMSQKIGEQSWSQPDKLDLQGHILGLCLAHRDGFLYYSVDKTGRGDFDIWRVKLHQITGKPIIGTEEPIPFAGVNKVGTDQADPSFSPGGNWFMFSSDEIKDKKRGLFYVQLPSTSDTISIKTLFRTYEFDSSAQEFVDVVKEYESTLDIEDVLTNRRTTSISNANGESSVVLPSAAGTRPIDDRKIRQIVVKSKTKDLRHISASDTLFLETGQQCPLQHTLTVWDVNVLQSDECKQNFPITRVEFFVTGYWCPTTKKYGSLLSCQSVFEDPKCTQIDNPELPCKENDLFTYTMLPAKVIKEKKSGLCIPQKEIDNFALNWSSAVDNAIGIFVQKMSSAMQKPCIVRTLRQRKPITIEIIGWTDPRSMDAACVYTGNDIDFNKGSIKLKDLQNKQSYLPNGILKQGIPFVKSPFGGNQLLSDLRAYYTALLLDSLWKTGIPKYNELRSNGMINVVAVGKSVNPDQIALAKQRSVNVIVYGEADAVKSNPYSMPELGRSVALCQNECLEYQMCKKLEQSELVFDKVDIAIPKKKQEVVVAAEVFNQAAVLKVNEKSAKYTIQVASVVEESKAKEIIGKMALTGYQNIELQTYQNILGIVYYRVRYGNFENLEIAKNALESLKKFSDLNPWKNKPVIIEREK